MPNRLAAEFPFGTPRGPDNLTEGTSGQTFESSKGDATRNVSFRESGGGPTAVELEVISQVKAFVGSAFPEDVMLRAVRKQPTQCNASPNFLQDVINTVLDSENQPIVEKNPSNKQIASLTKVNKESSLQKQVSFNRLPETDKSDSNVVDKEESDLQKALQESLVLSRSSFTKPSISGNPEDLIRNPSLSTGLYNAGNTCWFNCVAQILFKIPQFRYLVYTVVPMSYSQDSSNIDEITPESVRSRDLLVQLRRLFAEMEFSKCQYIEASSVLVVIEALGKSAQLNAFRVGQQQDVAESFIRLFDWIDSAMQKALEDRLRPESIRISPTASDDWIPIGSQPSAHPELPFDADIPPPPYAETPEQGANIVLPPSEIKPKLKKQQDENLLNNNDSGLKIGDLSQKSPTKLPSDDLPPAYSLKPLDISHFSEKGPSNPTTSQQLLTKEETGSASQNAETSTAPQAGSSAVSDEEKLLVETCKMQLNEMFEAQCVEERSGGGEPLFIQNRPMIIPLMVTYGNVHDALEAVVFDSSDRVNWYEKLPAVVFMTLSRFQYNGSRSEKLHNRFCFPKSLYLDRYMRRNAQAVGVLREKILTLRRELAETCAKLEELQKFPTGNGTVRLAESFGVVMNALATTIPHEQKPISESFLGTSSQQSSSLFLDFLRRGEISTQLASDVIDVLERARQELISIENEQLKLQGELTREIQEIYDIPALQNDEYRLHAAVVHSGEMDIGHYWSFIRADETAKREEPKVEGDLWERLNDKNVDQVSWEQVEKDGFGNGTASSSCAYFLVYVRTDATWIMERDSMTPEEAFSLLPDDLRGFVDEKAHIFSEEISKYHNRNRKEDDDTKMEVCQTTQTEDLRSVKVMKSASTRKVSLPEHEGKMMGDDLNELRDAANGIRSDVLRSLNSVSDPEIGSMQLKFVGIPNDEPLDESCDSRLFVQYRQAARLWTQCGKEIVENLLGYPLCDLKDCENDIMDAYQKFVGDWFENYERLPAPLPRLFTEPYGCFQNFLEALGFIFHARIYRFINVSMLSVCNVPSFKELARAELYEFKTSKPVLYNECCLLAEYISLLYETLTLATLGCSIAANHIVLYMKEPKLEHLYNSLQYSNLANFHFMRYERETSLKQLNLIRILQQWQIQAITIIPLLHLVKQFLTFLLTKEQTIEAMMFVPQSPLTLAKETVGVDEIVSKVVIGVRAMKRWHEESTYSTSKFPSSGLAVNLLLEVINQLTTVFEVLFSSKNFEGDLRRMHLINRVLESLRELPLENERPTVRVASVPAVESLTNVETKMEQLFCGSIAEVNHACSTLLESLQSILCSMFD
ncbi:unnamed protein product [Caenorhabditis auriculariae]|uniref:USP domain-containing protein n=1 Tax=Caenorhabditis auriculariae TaxID=2777116 RepID=A0A8S1H9L8_9PELO|nr:unnamed protein product [Caenorhabditis auriculariae]